MIGNEVLGKRLKYLRNRLGKSQEDVASAIGISRARYSHYENDHVEPDVDLIRRLANFYNVTTDYLLGSSDNPIRHEENERDKIINKIAAEFPNADLMFKDMEKLSADQLREVYEFIKFKQGQKDP